MSNDRTITKVLAAEEDMAFGEGTEQQSRAGQTVTVTKQRTIRPVNSLAELAQLDPAKFPKAAVVEGTMITFYSWDGNSYIKLTEQTPVEADSIYGVAVGIS